MLRTPLARVVCLVAVSTMAPACARPALKTPDQASRGSAIAPLEQLWQPPSDLAQRNLFWGPGQQANAPAPGAEYKVMRRDETGFSPGYDVVGPDGRRW